MTAAPIILPDGDLTAVVTVESESWGQFQRAIRDAGFVLRAVPAGPTQPPRYLLMDTDFNSINAQGLTEREYQVLRGISCGMTNDAIGYELHLSCDTIKTHCRRLFRKLGAHDRAHAVTQAFRAGLLT